MARVCTCNTCIHRDGLRWACVSNICFAMPLCASSASQAPAPLAPATMATSSSGEQLPARVIMPPLARLLCLRCLSWHACCCLRCGAVGCCFLQNSFAASWPSGYCRGGRRFARPDGRTDGSGNHLDHGWLPDGALAPARTAARTAANDCQCNCLMGGSEGRVALESKRTRLSRLRERAIFTL